MKRTQDKTPMISDIVHPASKKELGSKQSTTFRSILGNVSYTARSFYTSLPTNATAIRLRRKPTNKERDEIKRQPFHDIIPPHED